MGLVEQVYAAALNAGLLHDCRWQPPDSSPSQSHPVGFTAPDETVFDGLASVFKGLAPRDTVEIDGVIYQVRNIRAVGDGSEMRAQLTRV